VSDIDRLKDMLYDAGFNDWYMAVEQLEQQLKEAESVIEFYGDANNWSYQQVIDDVSEVNGSLEAGKCARNYFDKYKGDK